MHIPWNYPHNGFYTAISTIYKGSNMARKNDVWHLRILWIWSCSTRKSTSVCNVQPRWRTRSCAVPRWPGWRGPRIPRCSLWIPWAADPNGSGQRNRPPVCRNFGGHAWMIFHSGAGMSCRFEPWSMPLWWMRMQERSLGDSAWLGSKPRCLMVPSAFCGSLRHFFFLCIQSAWAKKIKCFSSVMATAVVPWQILGHLQSTFELWRRFFWQVTRIDSLQSSPLPLWQTLADKCRQHQTTYIGTEFYELWTVSCREGALKSLSMRIITKASLLAGVGFAIISNLM